MMGSSEIKHDSYLDSMKIRLKLTTGHKNEYFTSETQNVQNILKLSK